MKTGSGKSNFDNHIWPKLPNIKTHVIFFSKFYSLSSFGNSVDPDLLPSIDRRKQIRIHTVPSIHIPGNKARSQLWQKSCHKGRKFAKKDSLFTIFINHHTKACCGDNLLQLHLISPAI